MKTAISSAIGALLGVSATIYGAYRLIGFIVSLVPRGKWHDLIQVAIAILLICIGFGVCVGICMLAGTAGALLGGGLTIGWDTLVDVVKDYLPGRRIKVGDRFKFGRNACSTALQVDRIVDGHIYFDRHSDNQSYKVRQVKKWLGTGYLVRLS